MREHERTGDLNIDEVHIVGSSVNHRPESHGVSNLSVEPNVLVGGEKPGEFGANDTDDIAEHGHQDQTTIVGKDETGASRRPHRELEPVQSRELLVGFLVAFQAKVVSAAFNLRAETGTHLTVPSIGKEEEMCAIEKDVEREPPRVEELPLEPAFTHRVEAV